jgi:DNA-binding IscR family transcriptional regulator
MHISSKCSVAIHCLIYISEYSESKRVTSEWLSLSTGCNPVTIRGIMSALKKAGILSVKSGTGGAALNRPLEDIDLYQVTMAVEPDALDKLMGVHPMPSPLCPVGKNIRAVLEMPYAKIREDLKYSLQSISLKMIVDDYHKNLTAQQTESTLQ